MGDFAELIRTAQRGEIAALKQIVLQFEGVIRAECAQFGLWQFPEWSHSDLTQEAMMRVLTRLDQFASTDAAQPSAAFEYWVRITTRNSVRSLLRSRLNSRHQPGENIQPLPPDAQLPSHHGPTSPSSVISRGEQLRRVHAVMQEALDEPSCQILKLKICEGLAYAAIADRVGLSLDQVRYRFEQSLQKLSRLLGDPST